MFGDRGDPDFVNDAGVKWWREKGLTSYAHQENIKGLSLPETVVVWYVECPDGHRTYLIQDEDGSNCNGRLRRDTTIRSLGAYTGHDGPG